jgi:hypothetical protein
MGLPGILHIPAIYPGFIKIFLVVDDIFSSRAIPPDPGGERPRIGVRIQVTIDRVP